MNSLYIKTRLENGKTQPHNIAEQNREYLLLPELNEGRQLVSRMKQAQTWKPGLGDGTRDVI